jgi:hypothetical protein
MSYHIEINEYQRRLIMKALTSTDVNQFSQAPGSGDAFLRNVVAKYPFERFAQISRDPAEFWPWRLFAFELRSRQGCLRGRWSLAEVAGRAAISCRSRDDPAAAN